MFSLRFTFILAIILIIPFYLRYRYTEPYPAVLLPSGGYYMRKLGENTAMIENSSLWGLKSDGNWKQINDAQLLYPIPTHYFKFMFDQSSSMFDHKVMDGPNALELSGWLRTKLMNQQIVGPKIKLVVYKKTFYLHNGKMRDSIIINEKFISIPN